MFQLWLCRVAVCGYGRKGIASPASTEARSMTVLGRTNRGIANRSVAGTAKVALLSDVARQELEAEPAGEASV